MATSKTLTPTNVTIQIPEFTDQPDQRVNSNCIDKEADAINALNGNIVNITGTLLPAKANMIKQSIAGGASASGILYPCFIVGGRYSITSDAYCAFVDVVGAIQVIKSSSIFTVSVETNGVKITNTSGVTASFIAIY